MGKYGDLVESIKQKFEGEGTGHDWYHIQRVINTSMFIHKEEGGDEEVIKYAALLHDIDDHKFNGGDFERGAIITERILEDYGLSKDQKQNIIDIVRTISYKGSSENDEMKSIEGRIVQDADRIDAIGAIGIARTFAYGGSIGQPIYDPTIEPALDQNKEEYVKQRTHTINHFYEKLLLIGDRMKTDTGRKIASSRTQVMKDFLDQFYTEWNTYK